MKQAILDTNFILTCVKQKIDFFEWFNLNGIEILIPLEVINEIKKIIKSKDKKLYSKDSAELSLNILEKNKELFKKIKINEKYVDKGLIKFTKNNKNILLATLDRELKNKISNKNIVIRGKKKLEII